MDNFFGRSVFFVKDAEDSLAFYTQKLGFTLDWTHQEHGRAFVFQVSLFGFQLILNQVEEPTDGRSGHGRVFIGLESEQVTALRQHIAAKQIKATLTHWGAPTLAINDLDDNEFFFWLPESEWPSMESELAK